MLRRGIRVGRRDILALFLLTALVVAFLHSALIGGEQFYAGDTYRFFYPLKKMAADYVRAGFAPVWNPLVHSGMPLHAAVQAAVFYPFSLLFYVLPFDFAYKWYVALHLMLAAWGTYYLLRAWRLNCIPSALGGITYAFSGYMVSLIDGLNIFSSIAWLPLVFALFARAVVRPTMVSLVLAASALAAQTLAGDPVSGYYTFLLCGAYWLMELARPGALLKSPRETAARLAVPPVLAGLVLLLTYVQIGPAAELTRYSTRTVAIGYESATAFSLAPRQLLTLFVPYLFGNPIEDIYDWGRMFAPHFPLLRSIYVGAMTLLLVPVTLAAFKDRRVYFLAAALAASVLLSLGKHTPAYELAYRMLPVFSKFRYPTKAFFLCSFAFAALGAFGIHYMLGAKSEHSTRESARAFVRWYSLAVLAAAVAWLGFASIDRYVFDLTSGLLLKTSSAEESLTLRFVPYMKEQMFRASVVCAVMAALVWIWRKGLIAQRLLAFLVITCVVLDIVPTNSRAMDTISALFYSPPPVVAHLDADSGLSRLYRTPLDVEQRLEGLDIKTPQQYYLWNRELLSPNFGTLFGCAYTDGYESANLLWHNLFVRFVEGAPPLIRPRVLGLVNVKYIFSSHPVTHPDLRLKTSPRAHVYLYENARGMERAYFVPSAMIAPDEASALRLLASDAFDSNESVILVDRGGPGSLNPQVEGASGFEVALPSGFEFQTMDMPDSAPSGASSADTAHPVQIVEYSPNAVILSVNAPSNGYVVLCDSYYPKWRVFVNGKEQQLLRANCTVRTVAVAEGKSRIEFIYDTTSFRRAAMVSLGGLLLCLALGTFDVIVLRGRRGPTAQ
ncbi:MAG: hypothetical protein Kow0099_08900 [Candidatus Abyssubacteria bacterium]